MTKQETPLEAYNELIDLLLFFVESFGIRNPEKQREIDQRIQLVRETLERKGNQNMEKFINNKCLVRGDRSGVFFGTVKEINGRTVVMENVRRIWYWEGANSISELALNGTTKPNDCKFTVAVKNVCILDAIEINVCSEKAIQSIESVKEWKQKQKNL